MIEYVEYNSAVPLKGEWFNPLVLSSENWLYYDKNLSEGSPVGLHYIFRFPNNYGASVVKNAYSYGGKDNLWEIALIKFAHNDDYYLVYEEDFEGDVIGWLTDREIDDYLSLIRLYSTKANRDETCDITIGFSKELSGKEFACQEYNTTMEKALCAIRTLQKEFPDCYFDPTGSPEFGYSITVHKWETTPLYEVEPGIFGIWTKIF